VGVGSVAAFPRRVQRVCPSGLGSRPEKRRPAPIAQINNKKNKKKSPHLGRWCVSWVSTGVPTGIRDDLGRCRCAPSVTPGPETELRRRTPELSRILLFRSPCSATPARGVLQRQKRINFGDFGRKGPGLINARTGRLTAEPIIGIGFAYMWFGCLGGPNVILRREDGVVQRRRGPGMKPRKSWPVFPCVLTAYCRCSGWRRSGSATGPL